MILLVNRASVLLGLGQESGWALAREFAEDESTPQLAHERARGELNLGDAALRWGRYDEARRRLTSAAEIAGRHGYQVVRAAALVTLLRLDYLAGAWPGLAERAQEWADAAEEPVGRLEALLVGAQLRLSAAGGDQEGEDTLRAVQEECVRRGIIAQWLESAAARARLRLSAGDAAGALAVTEDGIGLVTDKGIWLWATQIAPRPGGRADQRRAGGGGGAPRQRVRGRGARAAHARAAGGAPRVPGRPDRGPRRVRGGRGRLGPGRARLVAAVEAARRGPGAGGERALLARRAGKPAERAARVRGAAVAPGA